jgi:hypothetical protein
VYRDYEKSKAFYLAALAPLAYSLIVEMDHDGAKIARFGWIRSDGGKKIDWWIVQTPAAVDLAISGPTHLANDRLGAPRSTRQQWRPAGRTMGLPVFGRITMPTTTAPSVLDPDGSNLDECEHYRGCIGRAGTTRR